MSIANVATRYILDHPGVAGVIVGARLGEREHIDDTCRLFSFPLTDDDRARDSRPRSRRCSPIPGDCGDEYRTPPFLTASGDLSHHLQRRCRRRIATFRAPSGRTLCLSGTPWEIDGRLCPRGAPRPAHQRLGHDGHARRSRLIGGRDPAAQTHFAIDKIEGALQSLGGVAYRRRPHARLREAHRATGSRWRASTARDSPRIMPANTLVGAPLVGDDYLVEIEAEAEIASSTQDPY